MPPQIEHFLSSYDAGVADTALTLRHLIKKTVKGVAEQLDVSARMIAYSLGPGYKGMICTVILSKKGVKLGFYRGIELHDPGHLLSGTGKVHRYVEVKPGERVSDDLKKLLRAADRACRVRLAG